tara:strand:- start:170 stop:577 length:408 start_codon:yes stop_codon:yes gene_type:complete
MSAFFLSRECPHSAAVCRLIYDNQQAFADIEVVDIGDKTKQELLDMGIQGTPALKTESGIKHGDGVFAFVEQEIKNVEHQGMQQTDTRTNIPRYAPKSEKETAATLQKDAATDADGDDSVDETMFTSAPVSIQKK